MRELGLFREWFLQRHLGVALDADEDAALAGIESPLVDAALAPPQVLVHRDLMLRNLMPAADGDGKRCESAKSVTGSVDRGGRLIFPKKTKQQYQHTHMMQQATKLR